MSRGISMNSEVFVSPKFYLMQLIFNITAVSFFGLFCHTSLAALSFAATTTQYIHGNPPEILESAETKILKGIQFKLNIDGIDPVLILPNIDNDNKISVAYNTSPSVYSFDVDTSSLNDSDINDVDGDQVAITDNFIIQSINTEWRDSNNNIIPSDSTSPLGSDVCNSSKANVTSSVKVTIQFVAKTQYGVPDTSEPRVVSKTFEISADDGICYIKPGVLALITHNGWDEGDNYAPYGADTISVDPPYNSDQFTIHEGFKPNATDQYGNSFPTYGFPEARFRIVPVNPIANYSYKLIKNSNNSLVNDVRPADLDSLSEFKFTDKVPDKGEKIVILISNNRTFAQFYYTFSINHWLYFTQNYVGNWENANRYCQNNNDRLPTRAELSNSPFANVPTTNDNYYVKGNGYQRAIGEGLTPEWGKVYFYSPLDYIGRDMMYDAPNLRSLIYYDFYFTSEASSVKDALGNYRYYSVGMVEGNIIVEPDIAYTLCVKY